MSQAPTDDTGLRVLVRAHHDNDDGEGYEQSVVEITASLKSGKSIDVRDAAKTRGSQQARGSNLAVRMNCTVADPYFVVTPRCDSKDTSLHMSCFAIRDPPMEQDEDPEIEA
jgi:hypothetical protein